MHLLVLVRYGLAENKNDRDYMEDRTTAKPRISGTYVTYNSLLSCDDVKGS